MTLIRTPQTPWQPQGTVYGTLLNFRREWDLWAPRMTQDPYKAAPQAPVLYVKSANTFNPSGELVLQDGITEVDIGATLGLVMGEDEQPEFAVLLNDWAVPHASYYRPPVKFRCRDGYLGVGSLRPWAGLDVAGLQLQVSCNGAVVQTVDFSQLKRPLAQLLADVRAFMSLQAGDLLMLGTDCLDSGERPRARAGDTVHIEAAGFAPLKQTVISALNTEGTA
jgi:5-oxopent-3-ene-1,2,5-tricarboxylate decarboxylase / 2-hydroxyhepta-2,4-diene-1,7-dioate isomerase